MPLDRPDSSDNDKPSQPKTRQALGRRLAKAKPARQVEASSCETAGQHAINAVATAAALIAEEQLTQARTRHANCNAMPKQSAKAKAHEQQQTQLQKQQQSRRDPSFRSSICHAPSSPAAECPCEHHLWAFWHAILPQRLLSLSHMSKAQKPQKVSIVCMTNQKGCLHLHSTCSHVQCSGTKSLLHLTC